MQLKPIDLSSITFPRNPYQRDGRWYWKDDIETEHGPCSSEASAEQRLNMFSAALYADPDEPGLRPAVSADEWRVKKDAEPEGTVHPCDDSAPWDCECASACACHWRAP